MADSEKAAPSEPGMEVQTQEPSESQTQEVPMSSDQAVEGSNPKEETSTSEPTDPQEGNATPIESEPQVETMETKGAESETVDMKTDDATKDVDSEQNLPVDVDIDCATSTAEKLPEISQEPNNTKTVVPDSDTAKPNEHVETVESTPEITPTTTAGSCDNDTVAQMDTDAEATEAVSTDNTDLQMDTDANNPVNENTVTELNPESKCEVPSDDILTPAPNVTTEAHNEAKVQDSECNMDCEDSESKHASNPMDTEEIGNTAEPMDSAVSEDLPVSDINKDQQNVDSGVKETDEAQTLESESQPRDICENPGDQEAAAHDLAVESEVDSKVHPATNPETETNQETTTTDNPEAANFPTSETAICEESETKVEPDNETETNPESEIVQAPDIETAVGSTDKTYVSQESEIHSERLEVELSDDSKKSAEEIITPECAVQATESTVESETHTLSKQEEDIAIKETKAEEGNTVSQTKDTEPHTLPDQSITNSDTVNTQVEITEHQRTPANIPPLIPLTSDDIPEETGEPKPDDLVASGSGIASPVQKVPSNEPEVFQEAETVVQQISAETTPDVQSSEQPLDPESMAPESVAPESVDPEFQVSQPAQEGQQAVPDTTEMTRPHTTTIDNSDTASIERSIGIAQDGSTVSDLSTELQSAPNPPTEIADDKDNQDMETDLPEVPSQNSDKAVQSMETDERDVESMEFMESNQQSQSDSSQGFSVQNLEASEPKVVEASDMKSIDPRQIISDARQDTENLKPSKEAAETVQASVSVQPSELQQPLALTAQSDNVQLSSGLSEPSSVDAQDLSVHQDSVHQSNLQEVLVNPLASAQPLSPSVPANAEQSSDSLQADTQQSSEIQETNAQQPIDEPAVVQPSAVNLVVNAPGNSDSLQGHTQETSATLQESPVDVQAADALPANVPSSIGFQADVQESSESQQPMAISQQPQPSEGPLQLPSAPEPSSEPQQYMEETQPFVVTPDPSTEAKASQDAKESESPTDVALELTAREPQQQMDRPETANSSQDGAVDFSIARDTRSNEAADISGDSNGCLVIDEAEAESKSDKDEAIVLSDTEAAAPVNLAMPKETPDSDVQITATSAGGQEGMDLTQPDRSMVTSNASLVVTTAVSTSVIMKTPTAASASTTSGSNAATSSSASKVAGEGAGKESNTVQISSDLQSSMEKVKADDKKSKDVRDVGWTNIEGVLVPYLSRGNTKYVSVKMVENKMLSKYPSIDMEDMKDAGPIFSYYITPDEAKLLTDINARCYKHAFGTDPFTVQDLIVSLQDFQRFYKNIRIHFEKLSKEKSADALTKEALAKEKAAQEKRQSESQRSKSRKPQVSGNWIQINNTVCPYILRGDSKFLPVNVLRFAARLLLGKDLAPHKVDCTAGEIHMINMLCKNGGVNFHFDVNTARLIQLETVIRLMHPEQILVRNLSKKHPFEAAVYNPDLGKPHNGITNGTQTSNAQKPNQNSGTHTSSSQQHLSGGSHQTINPPVTNTALLQLRQMVTSHTQQHNVGGAQVVVSSMSARSSAPVMPALQSISSHQQRAVQQQQQQQLMAPNPMHAAPGLAAVRPITIAPVDMHHIPGVPPSALRPKPDASSSSSHSGEALIKPIRLFDKTVSCILRAGERYALVEALTRLYFPNTSLKDFGKALQTMLRRPLDELTPKEEQDFINFYDLPVRSLKCKTIFPILSFEAIYDHLRYMFKDKKTLPKLAPKAMPQGQISNPAHQPAPIVTALQHPAFASSHASPHPRGTTPTPSEGSRSSTPSEGSGPSRRPASADSLGAPAAKKVRPNPAAPQKKLGNVLAKLKERQEHQLNRN